MNETTSHSVVAVKLRYNPKVFWFDPANGSYQTGDHVLVDTERGREIGLVVDGTLTVSIAEINALSTPLKPVVRALTDLDYEHIDALDAKGREALPVFREMIAKHGLDMKPVSVEFLFSGDKAVFYFSSDERVDFRELVRQLAAHFHIRVDMRQIGVRDEARMLGGLAHCGEELCCARLGGEFQPVSIRMAKEQDLPLNPVKISGACGRLMCCLRYEFEAYKDFKSRAPKKGAVITTPLGQAKVIDFDTPREVIHMRLEDGKSFAIPLRDFDSPGEDEGCQRPCCISRNALEACPSSGIQLALAAIEREAQILEEPEVQARTEIRRPRRRSAGKSSPEGQESQHGQQAGQRPNPQPSRQSKPQPRPKPQPGQQPKPQAKPQPRQQQKQQPGQQPKSQADSQLRPRTRQRPGQNSSGIRAERERPIASECERPIAKAMSSADEQAPRRRRRRRSGNGGSGTDGSSSEAS